jgi:hypothetical protein
MADTAFEKIVNNIIPPKNLQITLGGVEKECLSRNIDFKKRTIQFYITHGILPRPIPIGRETVYNKDKIMDEVISLFIIKNIFGVRSVKDLKKIANNEFLSFKDLFLHLNDVLRSYFDFYNQKGIKGQEKVGVMELPNYSEYLKDPVAKNLIKDVIDDVKKGNNPTQTNIETRLIKFTTLKKLGWTSPLTKTKKAPIKTK